MNPITHNYVPVAQTNELQTKGHLVVRVEGKTIALFHHQERIYAVDNRCPHMGFPLHQGSVSNCILTCHWHHARFDLESGGTFDPWADDARSFPVQIRSGEVWLDPTDYLDAKTHAQQRLIDGLEQNISLIIAKSVLALLAQKIDLKEVFQVGLNFGVRYRNRGWSTALTTHTCIMNLLPYLDERDRPRALYHGVAAIAAECAGEPPRFEQQPLPLSQQSTHKPSLLESWFRQFIEVRDFKGAERCLVSAIELGVERQRIIQMLFAAATDHRYLDDGHILDFTNKALEALDTVEWQNATSVLASLVRGYVSAERKEESNAWRYPIDLVAIVEKAFSQLDAAIATGRKKIGSWNAQEQLVIVLLEEDPQSIVNSLLQALQNGATFEALAGTVTYAASLRIAQFSTNNDLGDWNTAHHSFIFAHAVESGLRRVSSLLLLRGVFDGAMTVYLNRFLNVPPARLPESGLIVDKPEKLLKQLPELLDRQQQVDEAGKLVASYLHSGGNPDQLLTMLGKLLLREDRDFHTIQEIEAAFRQYTRLRGTKAGIHVLVAATRHLAAHTPTRRSQGQTYEMAEKLHQGERVFEAL